jgi:hypothetical protein
MMNVAIHRVETKNDQVVEVQSQKQKPATSAINGPQCSAKLSGSLSRPSTDAFGRWTDQALRKSAAPSINVARPGCVELVEVEAAGAVRTIVSFLLRKAKYALDRPDEVQFGRGGGLLGLENG